MNMGWLAAGWRGRLVAVCTLAGLMALPAYAERAEGVLAVSAGTAEAAASAPSIYGLDTLMPVSGSEVTGAEVVEAEAAVEFDRGNVSWYGGRFHGRRTASGERFDMYALTAAHPTLPFGTRIKVRRLDTGQEIEVRINDRGPHARGRILDLSRGAAQALGVLQAGEAAVALLKP